MTHPIPDQKSFDGRVLAGVLNTLPALPPEDRQRVLEALTWMRCFPKEDQDRLWARLAAHASWTGARGYAKDVISAARVVLVRKYPGLLDPVQFAKVAMTTVANCAAPVYRERARWADLDFDISSPTDLEQEAIRRERIDRLVAALKNLSPQRRKLIELLLFQGCEIEEAAGILGITRNAVDVLKSRTIRQLQKLLGVKEENHGRR
jgi:RNA polymerase sigma factor (sigma-70 family)